MEGGRRRRGSNREEVEEEGWEGGVKLLGGGW